MPAVFRHAVVVGPESIDVLNHANNREYLRWMEEAAVAHSDARGWPTARYLALGASWVAATHRLDYLRPALLGDRLHVWTWIAELDATISRRRYVVARAADGKALALGYTRWAFVDLASGRATPVPAAVADSFIVVPDADPQLAALGPARRALALRLSS